MYRPQFAYATPDGYTDEDFTYSFDSTNTPLLNLTTGLPVFIQNVVLPLEPDEVFMWRGVKVISYSFVGIPFFIQFRGPEGDYLSLCPVPMEHICVPSGAIGWGFATVPFEPEIPCPAGSNLLVNIQLVNSTNPSAVPHIVAYGVKRGPLIQK